MQEQLIERTPFFNWLDKSSTPRLGDLGTGRMEDWETCKNHLCTITPSPHLPQLEIIATQLKISVRGRSPPDYFA